MKNVREIKKASMAIAIAFTFTALLPLKSFAIGDAAVVAQLVKNLAEMKKQYTKLEEQYKAMQQQYQTLENIQGDAEGHYGFGNLLNSAQGLTNREWSPDDWDSALKGLSGGNPSRYQQLLQEYKEGHPSLSTSEYEKSESADNAKTYGQEVEANQAASTNATYAFNDIKKHLEDVHALSMQIDKTNNTKAAIDLNSRLLTEMAYVQIQELKMETLLNEQAAEASSSAIASETEAAKFDQLPTR